MSETFERIQPHLKPLFWGAVAGMALTLFVGFKWGGLMTTGDAEKLAKTESEKAVIVAMTPLCVGRADQDPNFAAEYAQFQGKSSWEMGTIVEKAGWSKVPGSTSASYELAGACAQAILERETKKGG